MEDKSLLSPTDGSSLSRRARSFLGINKDAGYTPGVYASANWWKNHLTSSSFNKWSKWVAQYKRGITKPEYDGKYDMWQATSGGSVNGISGNVSISFWMDEKEAAKDHGVLRQDPVSGNWYVYTDDDRINTGYNGLILYNNIWWYVKDGKVEFGYTGMAPKPTGELCYVKNGQMDTSYNGLVQYNGAWYYVKKGQVIQAIPICITIQIRTGTICRMVRQI